MVSKGVSTRLIWLGEIGHEDHPVVVLTFLSVVQNCFFLPVYDGLVLYISLKVLEKQFLPESRSSLAPLYRQAMDLSVLALALAWLWLVKQCLFNQLLLSPFYSLLHLLVLFCKPNKNE